MSPSSPAARRPASTPRPSWPRVRPRLDRPSRRPTALTPHDLAVYAAVIRAR